MFWEQIAFEWLNNISFIIIPFLFMIYKDMVEKSKSLRYMCASALGLSACMLPQVLLLRTGR